MLERRIVASLWFVTLMLFASINGNAQWSIGGTPRSLEKGISISKDIPQKTMPSINLEQLIQEDAQDVLDNLPPRFGYPFKAPYSLDNSGTWTDLADGSRVWQLKISCPGATSINLTFSDFYMPAGAKFFVSSADYSTTLGAFTSANNKADGNFATGLIRSDEIILEYNEPANVLKEGRIKVASVIHGYKDIPSMVADLKDFGDANSCNINVNCPQGGAWQQTKQSVAVLLTSGNFRFCTGALINNVPGNCTPYLLTANHCVGGSGAGSSVNWIFMFNYESSGCANPSTEPSTSQTVQGGLMRATGSDSDFALVELSEDPSLAPNVTSGVWFAGWSRSTSAPSSSVGIHHPEGDIKKICIDDDPATSTTWFGTPNTHWECSWDEGITASGSSGSPLFNSAQQIVGQLHGGGSFCNTPQAPDQYGKVSYSWESNGNNSGSRLRDWLDPGNTGALSIGGSGGNCGVQPTCTDGQQNGFETGVDCGGPTCPSCPPCLLGQNLLMNETFGSCGQPSSWTTSHSDPSVNFAGNCQGNNNAFAFTCTEYPGISSAGSAGPPPGFSGCVGVIDDDTLGDGGATGVGCLLTPVFAAAGYNQMNLSVDYQNETTGLNGGEGVMTIDVFDGNNWVNLLTSTSDANGTLSTDVTQYVNNQLQFRFCYDDENSWAWGMAIDNVRVCGVQGGNCFDGVQNNGETGIDCGGPCNPCGSCFDGIQNGFESGIDCGGFCSPCDTCFDGMENGNETGVDCGGSCPPCVTCSDGIQNGFESGVDCGGPVCTPCPPVGNGVALNCYLEGFMDGNSGIMNTDLNTNGLIPTTQPFNIAPFFYSGIESLSATESVPQNAVDWVYVEARSADNAELYIDGRAGFLLSNGSVVDLDGVSPLNFFNLVEGQAYYFALYHKSHLAVMTATSVSVQNATFIDFNNPNNVLGTGQVKPMGAFYALHAGDFDNNGILNILDFLIWFDDNSAVNVYANYDADGNGLINILDFLLWFNNNSVVGTPEIQF